MADPKGKGVGAPAPIPEARLDRWRRRHEALDEEMHSIPDDKVYGYDELINLMQEVFHDAKCVPLLLDEIKRLKEEINARTTEHPTDTQE